MHPQTLPVSDAQWKPWTTQRIANRFPVWSRIRERDDAGGQHFFNAFCMELDRVLEEDLKARYNYYITSVDLLEQPFAYVLSLPRTFEFTTSEHSAGRFTYTAPTITATVGAETFSVTVSKEGTIQSIDKASVLPTRLSASLLHSTFSDVVVPETAIVDLSTAVINDNYLGAMGGLYIEIGGASLFGENLSDGTYISPQVIITGTPWGKDNDEEEHLAFLTNAERPTSNRWKSLTSLEVRGIYDNLTTLRAHSGFSKLWVREPLAFWEEDTRESILVYGYENSDLGSSRILPTIQFKVPEIAALEMQQQGWSDVTMEYEFALMLDESTYLQKALVGFDRMPFTRWFVAATEDDLLFFSARIPHPFSWIHEDSNGENVISKALRDRSPGAEMEILADSNWVNFTEGGWDITIHTRHKKPVRGITNTRLSIEYDSPGRASPTRIYYDWDGNVIDITTDPRAGWIWNSHALAAPEEWNEKKLTLNILSVVDHPAWVAAVKLETKFSDQTTEADVFVIHSDYRQVERTLAFPASIRGRVAGLTFDARGRLLVRTTDNELWYIPLYWDHCLVDYQRNVVFFREDYDSVVVSS